SGYLFASAQLEEHESGTSGAMDLTITINDRGLHQMEFQGETISSSKLDKFKRWWREGFSEESVAELIRGDLLMDLWLKGFHRAQVEKKTEMRGNVMFHIFVITPGPAYPSQQIAFNGLNLYQDKQLRKDLKALFDNTPR